MAPVELWREWARRYPTPFYLYDLAELRHNHAALRRELPTSATLLYSLKANPLPALARTFRELGAWAEVSSTGELEVARAAEFTASQILYSGPAKTPAEVAQALGAGVRWFSLESREDHACVAAEAAKQGARVNALLRLNPAGGGGAQLAMTGTSSQFGFETDAALALLRDEARFPSTSLCGVHVFFGTQAKSVDACASYLRDAWQAAVGLAEQSERRWQVVDLGGGFPWPFASAGAGDLAGLGKRLTELGVGDATTSCWFESGRYLVASAGTLVTRVISTKLSRGKKFVLLESGINHLGGMAGLGRLWRPQPTLIPLSGAPAAERARERVEVVGPLCTTLDSLGSNVDAPRLEAGDYVAIPNAGAYGVTASLTGFLSRPSPLELVCDDGKMLAAYRLRTGHQTVPLAELTRVEVGRT